MLRVAELTDEWLDFWTGRAEGYKPWFTRISAGSKAICTIGVAHDDGAVTAKFYRPSADWAQGGPLIEKHELTLMRWKYSSVRALAEKDFWAVELPCNSHYIDTYRDEWADEGSETALQAICRAVVRAKFGDEVPDIN